MKYYLGVTTAFVLVASGVTGFFWHYNTTQHQAQLVSLPTALPTYTPTPVIVPTLPSQTNLPSATPSPVTSPNLQTHIALSVPFLVQAPLANWDAAHEEACEEASLIMVEHFLNKTAIASPNEGDKEITTLLQYEIDHGYEEDVTVSELAAIAKDYYVRSEGRVITSVTIEGIKHELAAGHPVIVPAAGRQLGNPNFRSPGPLYHMLVITGYDAQGFITNDPGTRKGQNYRYSFSTLYNAIHDWDTDNILNGAKNALVFDA